jgi:REP element-mobilizing transposase RayT
MGRSRFKFYEEYYPYFVTNSIVGGVSVFDDQHIAQILLESLKFIQTEFEAKLYGFVLMHNHLHMIIEADGISEKLRRFKSYTARKIIDSLTLRNRHIILERIRSARVTQKEESEYQCWQEGSHPIQIDSDKKMTSCLDYIHYNPVKAGFVLKPEDWRYSSIFNYLKLDDTWDFITRYESEE